MAQAALTAASWVAVAMAVVVRRGQLVLRNQASTPDECTTVYVATTARDIAVHASRKANPRRLGDLAPHKYRLPLRRCWAQGRHRRRRDARHADLECSSRSSTATSTKTTPCSSPRRINPTSRCTAGAPRSLRLGEVTVLLPVGCGWPGGRSASG